MFSFTDIAKWSLLALDALGNALKPDGSYFGAFGRKQPVVSSWTRLADVNDFLNINGRSAGVWTQVNITGTQDTAVFRREGASLKLPFASASASTMQVQANTTINWDLTAGGVIGILIYLAKLPANTVTVTLQLGANSTDYKAVNFDTASGILHLGWNFLVIHTSEDGTTFFPYYNASNPDTGGATTYNSGIVAPWAWTTHGAGINFATTHVAYARVQIGSNPGFGAGATGIAWLEGIYYGGKGRPQVVVGFDGAYSQLANYAIPTAAAKGILATIHPIGTNGTQPDFAPSPAVAQAIAAGWSVAHHTLNHTNLTTIASAARLALEQGTMRDQLQIQYQDPIAPGDMSVSPNLAFSELTCYTLAAAGTTMQRGGCGVAGGGNQLWSAESLVGLDFPQAFPCCPLLSSTAVTSDLLNIINGVVKYSSTLLLYTHAVVGPLDKVNNGGSFTYKVATTSGLNVLACNTNQYNIPNGASVTGAGIPGGTTITGTVPGTGYTISNNATATATGVTATIGASGGPCFYGPGDATSTVVSDTVFSSSVYTYTWTQVVNLLATLQAAGTIDVLTYDQWKARTVVPLPAVSMPPIARYNITVGASAFAYVAPRPSRVFVTGGTVSDISVSRDGVTFDSTGLTSGSFILAAGEQLKVTYSVAPTMVGCDLQ